MQINLIKQIQTLNPWLDRPSTPISMDSPSLIPRQQTESLLLPDWDNLWLILTGPRQVGKTTLAKFLCQELVSENRFDKLLLLNCDFFEIRDWLNQNPLFIYDLIKSFNLNKPILFIDEVQRLESPGLLMKTIVDAHLGIKLIATGSSQLEIKSKVQEHLTGRHLDATILPLSFAELKTQRFFNLNEALIFGCYPGIVNQKEKQILLQQLYDDYFSKDLLEILKIGKPDTMQRLLSLLAHSSGQLINHTKLSSDCRVSTTTIYNYLDILEKTFVVQCIKPFVGNKRSEIISNPIYYFIDNGFRNQALKNFTSLEIRTDVGLLVENAVFQEIYKFKTQNFMNFDIHFWRSKAGAEVDFVINAGNNKILPIEVKYTTFSEPKISRSYRSFLQAYQPTNGVVVTKNFVGEQIFENCRVHFVAMEDLAPLLLLIREGIK